jgi:methionyl aminopeptidase
MIQIKSPAEINLYRDTGAIAAEVLTLLIDQVAIGNNTYDIAEYAKDLIINKFKARPSSIGQYGFQFALNSSINNVICHGVPNKNDILKAGDIINLDVTVEKHGFIADTSRMYSVGEISSSAKKLCDVSYECLQLGIKEVKPGAPIGNIGFVIQRHAEKNGYSVVRDYCGHGIGRQMHEEPQIVHFGKKGTGMPFKEGMTFTIEPMINEGTMKTKLLHDKWTVITMDGKLSAQWEHTIAVTKDGFEILTLREEEKIK